MLPASAGMIRRVARAVLRFAGAPRQRGDDPSLTRCPVCGSADLGSSEWEIWCYECAWTARATDANLEEFDAFRDQITDTELRGTHK